MKRQVITVVLALILIGFIVAGATNIRHTNEKIKLHEIELKSRETKLQELNIKYDKVLEQKTNTEAEKQEQLNKIQELENERQRLQAELQAKRDRNRLEQQKLAEASRKATATPKASAATGTSNCNELRTKMSALGVNGSELDAAITLASRESSCRSSAVNKSSGACGEYQSYPCGKWGTPGTQQYLQNAIAYARGRYGSYNAALAHSYANNWY